ncbi:MAG: ankyrin repeat domain-containing protein [Bacilli bacterium]|nr:ankyrin repeat domain-containing protein [Bacilli bacterium]
METIYRLYKDVGDNLSENIFDAVMRNDCRYIINYYEEGNDINITDNRGENLVHKASRNNNYEVVDLLLKLKVDVNAQNRYLDTPLHLAVQFRNSEVVERLLFERARVNARNKKGVSPLHIASSNGKEEILNSLLDHGAKLNIADQNGMKPIHYAVKSGKKSVIRSLLNNGASLVEVDDRKNNVLHHACEAGNDDLVIYILRHMMVIDSKNIYGETPLHLAAKNCSINGLKALIAAGYEIEAKNDNDLTPIDVAHNSGKLENYEFLNNYYRSQDYKDKFLKYSLHRAVCRGDYDFLLQEITSINVNNFDYFGKSLMYYAIIMGSLRIVKLLYKKGARIDNIDEYNQSALLIAIYSENYEITKFLLEHKANVNEIYYGRSYLYRAILRNDYETAKLLIEHKADVNYIDDKHITIYSYAIEYASDEIIELLLNEKASLV